MSAIKNISLYIPHVFPNFDKEYVANAFKHIGEISQIDFVAKQDRNGKNFNAVYVHFNKWYKNKDNINFQYNVENGSEKWYHDDSQYYWIVLPNNAKKHIPGERKARIDLGESKSISTSQYTEVCLDTPQKRSYADAIKTDEKPFKEFVKQSHNINFDEVAAFEAEIEAEMDEIEEFLEAEDQHLISIDGRYVEQLEQKIAELTAALRHCGLVF
jgi:hypothetical protein